MAALLSRLGIHPRPGLARALAAAPLVLLVVYLVARGWLYPLWPDTVGAIGHPFPGDTLVGAWGGPTLVGAWAVRAALSLGIQAVCVVVLRRLYPRTTR
ncbi:hypothetical protein [Umezawaea sp. Da 62-37]|uniref:hypothetical protein n=1 Tax=Umezawaea sp. Da 62-37 TaxID=3075927 RepID=UPI0028F6DD17|nr:hypothetical protein [Umezawaea sp. Da 62-37]WNV87556.1 hypothetical protein RM788_04440 [Umezawaea sp. Da 62-37]